MQLRHLQKTLFIQPVNKKNRAFSLLEMSIVVIIVGIMVAAIMPVLTQNAAQKKQADLKLKMDAIEQALVAYRTANNRLPCPAEPLALTAANFGEEAATAGTCTGGTPAALSRLDVATDGGTVYGMVPVAALGLDDDAAFDPWGRAFSYIVDRRITATDSFTTYEVDDTVVGNISVEDASATFTAQNVLAAVLSTGTNGHGGYLPSGSRYTSGSTNTKELANCYCSTAGATTASSATLVKLQIQRDSSTSQGTVNTFDDILRYYVRSKFTIDKEINAAN